MSKPPEYAVYYPEVDIPYPWEKKIAELQAKIDSLESCSREAWAVVHDGFINLSMMFNDREMADVFAKENNAICGGKKYRVVKVSIRVVESEVGGLDECANIG